MKLWISIAFAVLLWPSDITAQSVPSGVDLELLGAKDSLILKIKRSRYFKEALRKERRLQKKNTKEYLTWTERVEIGFDSTSQQPTMSATIKINNHGTVISTDANFSGYPGQALGWPTLNVHKSGKGVWFKVAPEEYAVRLAAFPKNEQSSASDPDVHLLNLTVCENKLTKLTFDLEDLRQQDTAGALSQKVRDLEHDKETLLAELAEARRGSQIGPVNAGTCQECEIRLADSERELEECVQHARQAQTQLTSNLQSCEERLRQFRVNYKSLAESQKFNQERLLSSFLNPGPIPLKLLIPTSQKTMDFVLVHSGAFHAGLTEEDVDDLIRQTRNPSFEMEEVPADRRRHEFPKPFLIGKYEVTHEQYSRFDTQHRFSGEDAKKPVTGLTEAQILKFIGFLDEEYATLDIALPTELEWEFAAKGAEGRSYTWAGDYVEGRANINGEGPAMVGSRPSGSSWTGAMDMIGNVAEVCALEPDVYRNSGNGEKLVARGGSFRSDAFSSRTTSRHLLWDPQRDDVGFRVVVRPAASGVQ